MYPRGQIIAFEGLDCSFKETNFKRFVEYLRLQYPKESKRSLITASFPRYGHGACVMVEKFLENRIDSTRFRANFSDTVCSFYSMDRLDFWNHFYEFNNINLTYFDIARLPQSCFVFDRYSLSNAIYNPDNGEYVTEQDIMKEKERFGNPLPTILVWLRMMDRPTYLQILSKKSGKDFNEANMDFMAMVWERTEKMINSDILRKCGITPVIIECLDEELCIRSREDIFADVIKGINRAIDERECQRDDITMTAVPTPLGGQVIPVTEPGGIVLCNTNKNQEDE